MPTGFQEHGIQENHEFLKHVGTESTWEHLSLRYQWADEKAARKYNQEMTKKCVKCQANKRGDALKEKNESTPISPAPVFSVAIDLFKLPQIQYEGTHYDTISVCVDRHSGWIVAIPCLAKGLTGRNFG